MIQLIPLHAASWQVLTVFKLLWPAYLSCFLAIPLHPSSSCVLLNVIFVVIDASTDLYPREVFSTELYP